MSEEQQPAEQSAIEIEKGELAPPQIKEVEEGHFYTIKQLAHDLSYSVAWITCLVQKGRIKAIKPLGGSWRIPASEVSRVKKEGIPPLPRVIPAEVPGEIVVEGEHLEKVKPVEKTEVKEGGKGKPAWPLSIILK